jgi:glutamine---fructose-6-phosphate transaminase (isomerizing)
MMTSSGVNTSAIAIIDRCRSFPAEAMRTAQFSHGPLEPASRDAAAILVGTEPATRGIDASLASRLTDVGVAVLLVGCDPAPSNGPMTMRLGELDRAIAPAAAIVPVQLLAWKLAVERGFSPGTYSRASKVTLDE